MLNSNTGFSRHAGHRFGDKLKVIVPKVAEFAHSAGDNDDLRESAMQVSNMPNII